MGSLAIVAHSHLADRIRATYYWPASAFPPQLVLERALLNTQLRKPSLVLSNNLADEFSYSMPLS